MSGRKAASGVDQKKVVVIEYDKIQGTYLELGFWDDDIGAEKYAELLNKGQIREEPCLDFDGNLVQIHGQPNVAIPLKNETIFRCLCTPDLQNCRACFMRRRTIFAEGRAQLARFERRAFKAAARHYKAKAGVLEAEVAVLTSQADIRDAEVATLNTELDVAKAQLLAMKDFMANRFTGAVQALGAAHHVAGFHEAADAFEKEGGNVGLSARAGAFGHPAERAPTSDAGVAGAGALSGSPGSDGDITDSDDEDIRDGLARKRRRVSSAGPSLAPTSTAGGSSRRRPSSSLGARRKLPASGPASSSLPALAVPASSGPELPPPFRRRKLPASAASAHAVSASSVPEAQKPAGRSSWNSRSAQLDFGDAVPAVPMASIAAAVAEENAVLAASGSRKRKATSPSADIEVGLGDSKELRSASPADDTDNDADADADSDTSSGSDSDSDTAAPAAAPAPAPAPAPATRRRTTTWTEHEKTCLIAVMVSHAAAVKAGARAAIHDVKLWDVIQGRLVAEHGIDRLPQACRMVWNRELREKSGLDERVRGDPSRMATSLQRKAGQ
ncbi:hypothetical protein VF21_02222 [Pseudogymnoascus sp. 05NY08]|nr:hypothetical protein VF21_02222 [Pseudogymnoascus sp. 05NY08]